MNNNIPSTDPANNNVLTGAIKTALRKSLEKTDDMMPAQVLAFDPGPPRMVQLQPLIPTVGTSGSITPKFPLPRIPVVNFGGGGFILLFPIAPGDKGFIKANDRDISLYIQSLTNPVAEQPAPNTQRLHSFSDAVFIPTKLVNYVLGIEDINNMVLQSLDGTVKISLGTGKITIAAPAIEIDTILATLNGNLLVNGNIVATGTITPGG